MEAIPAQVVLDAQLSRERVSVIVLWNGCVERGVEYRDVRAGEVLLGHTDAEEVVRVVQRRERDAPLDRAFNGFIDHRGSGVERATVYHSVTNHGDVSHVADEALARREELDDLRDSGGVVGDIDVDLPRPIGVFVCDRRAEEPNSVDKARANALGLAQDDAEEPVLERRRPRVEDERFARALGALLRERRLLRGGPHGGRGWGAL
mmetsp:Transcript_49334/g.122594  ORF Transcript_49334/g.122594 Transcript_49334/m.122594 type:complete len:206 (-) Transcript_49334:16-633(-)